MKRKFTQTRRFIPAISVEKFSNIKIQDEGMNVHILVKNLFLAHTVQKNLRIQVQLKDMKEYIQGKGLILAYTVQHPLRTHLQLKDMLIVIIKM